MNAALEEKPELEEEYNLSGLSDAQQKIKKHNDIELLKEALLEFPCEGKTYPLMIRIAKRWNDYSLISRFVCEKYPESKQAEIRSKIENSNAYFVPWDLTKTASSHNSNGLTSLKEKYERYDKNSMFAFGTDVISPLGCAKDILYGPGRRGYQSGNGK